MCIQQLTRTIQLFFFRSDIKTPLKTSSVTLAVNAERVQQRFMFVETALPSGVVESVFSGAKFSGSGSRAMNL